MISKGFKDRVKSLLYTCYKIKCEKFITGSYNLYFINAKDELGRSLSLTLSIDDNMNGYSVSPQFNIHLDSSTIIDRDNRLFSIDKIQNAMDKSMAILTDVNSKYIKSLNLEGRKADYILLMGGCVQKSSYLNITYTIPYSSENGFILCANGYSHKIIDIIDKNHNTEFMVFDEAKSVVTSNYLANFKFHLKDGEQKLLDDYILKTIISYDISLHSYDLKDPDALNFLNNLKYDLITYDDISYVKDFYTVINMIKV